MIKPGNLISLLISIIIITSYHKLYCKLLCIKYCHFSVRLLSEIRTGFDRETEGQSMEEAEKPCSKKEERRPLPYQQQTRMATTGRIAAEGNLVHSIEDADPYSPPLENHHRNSATQDQYHLYLYKR